MSNVPPEPQDYVTGPDGLPRHPGSPEQPMPEPATRADQPQSIQLAVKLMRAGAALAGLSLIATVVTLGSLKDQIQTELRRTDPNVAQSTIDASYAVAIGFGIVIGLIGIGLWLWLAWKNGQGRSWARFVATVLAGLNVLFTLFSFVSSEASSVSAGLSVVSMILGAVIVVLLWRKDSNEFYLSQAARLQR